MERLKLKQLFEELGWDTSDVGALELVGGFIALVALPEPFVIVGLAMVVDGLRRMVKEVPTEDSV